MDQIQTIQKILSTSFGYDSFRGTQATCILDLLNGQDVFAIMPTGMGKSLIYQVAGLKMKGITLIVSPLIALMQDQCKELLERNISASFVNSSLTEEERKKRLENLRDGEYKFFFVTPERFQKNKFKIILKELDISLLVIDEAHCISEWGHDFRPDYLLLKNVKQYLKTSPPLLLLTATATLEVQKDICELLQLKLKNNKVYFSGIRRKNLKLGVFPVYGEREKLQKSIQIMNYFQASGIIYVSLIKTLVRIQDLFISQGLHPLIYHGKLPADVKKKNQETFMLSNKQLMIATNAFGMGINKKNIRYIIHWEIPGSVEAYYQEIGRSGRDQEISACSLLYDTEDILIQSEFMKQSNPSYEFLIEILDFINSSGEPISAKKCLQHFSAGPWDHRLESAINILKQLEIIQVKNSYLISIDSNQGKNLLKADYIQNKLNKAHHQLNQIKQYCENTTCRLSFVEKYFTQEPSGPCGICDVCLSKQDNNLFQIIFRESKEPKPSLLKSNQVKPSQSTQLSGGSASSEKNESPRFQVGDWVNINRIGMGQVKQVQQNGKVLTIERSDNFSVIKINTDDLKVSKL